jgi:hypothetical protein
LIVRARVAPALRSPGNLPINSMAAARRMNRTPVRDDDPMTGIFKGRAS